MCLGRAVKMMQRSGIARALERRHDNRKDELS